MTNSKVIEVTAAIIFQEGKVLLARRGPSKHLAGYWEFPGGKIEAGETPEICLIREIQEELGVVVRIQEFFLENAYKYENESILLKSYICQLKGAATFKLTAHDRIAWVTREDLHSYKIAPADFPVVKALTEQQLLQNSHL